MAEPWYSALPVVVLDGRELAENWAQELEEAWVETSVAQPSQAFLRFRDPDRAALDKHNLNVAIGTPLVVKVSVDGVLEPLFAGEVTALQTQYSAEDGTFTVVRGMDGGHRLLRGRQVIAYADTTIKKIVEKIAMRAKLQCGDVEADGTSLPYVAQPNMTDWEMLQHLAHEHGLRVSMEGSRGTVLCLRRKAPGAGKPRVWREQNLLSVDAVLTSTDQVDTVEVRGWEVKTRTVLKGKADIEKSDRVRVGMKPSETTRPFGKARLLVSGRPYASMHEVESAARALAADCAAGFAQLQAEAEGDPALRAGQWVTLADIGAPFAGDYTVSSCRHIFGRDPESQSTTFSTQVLVGHAPSGPVPAPAPLCAHGVAIAVVADTKEPHDGQHGWVRLRLPWLQDHTTDWVRSVQYGGAWGGGVLPVEADDEVLIAFEHGRLDRPFVLGGLYNGKNHPSDHDGVDLFGADGKANRRSLVSRDGDRIELLTPTEGPQGIRLVTGKKEEAEEERLSLLLDRSAHAVVLSAGTDEKAVSFTLDHAEQHAVLSAGADTEDEHAQIRLDQKKKTLSLTTGKTKPISITLDHEANALTLNAGADTDDEHAQIRLDQKKKTLSLTTGKTISITLDHEAKALALNAAGGKLMLQAEEIEIAANSNLTLRSGNKVTIDGQSVDIN
ncbi:VgrG-related protein [Streptomyces formicae]|uniref:VgrG-related protein n=1 Tax=Streptomyces formicae TaxID=1616117 RepID=UPI003613D5F3